MNRRKFLTSLTTAGAALAGGAPALRAANEKPIGEIKGLVLKTSKLTPPAKGGIAVAIPISAGLNVIDFSGPWGAFESVMVPNATEAPFRLFTIADTLEIVTSGSGLKLRPDCTYADAPEVNVIVIPAQQGSDGLIEWLRKTAPKTDVTMSVCTGAFKLAKAGLLAGKAATTHHEFLDKLAKDYPDIDVKRGVRFVEGEKISTAGGLTSGTDLALRVIERYYGRPIAQATADYMEYQSKSWII